MDIYIIGSIQSSKMSLKDINKILKSHPELVNKWKSQKYFIYQQDHC